MEQRSQPRFPADGTVTISVIGSAQEPVCGKLANVSDDGVMVTITEPLGIGDAVQVDGGDDLIVGEVRHCDQNEEGYLVGFSISDWVSKGALRESIHTYSLTCA